MKGHAAAAPLGKRRWRAPPPAVLALVFFSVLIPLAFLMGLHNRFPSGYMTDDRLPLETSFVRNGRVDSIQEYFEVAHPSIDKIIKKFGVSPTKEIASKTVRQAENFVSIGNGMSRSEQKNSTSQFRSKSIASKTKELASHSKVMEAPKIAEAEIAPPTNLKENSGGSEMNRSEVQVDDTKKQCQLEFGSYCLWSIEHKETMRDSVVKRLKDQLFVARAYYPSIAKLKARENLSRELKQNIQDHERMLSDAISDANLPLFVMKKIMKMDETIAKAKSCTIDCSNVERKLRQILDLAEDEAHFHMKQSAFLYNLGVQTIPKSLHCLSLRLTVEYFRSPSPDRDLHGEKHRNPSYRHYVIYSINVIAASVTINSTVMNSRETENMVFHLITDKQNYYAMKYWFALNSYREASIHILCVDQFRKSHPYGLAPLQLSPSEEFRISMHNRNGSLAALMKTEYISVFGHSHFLLPKIFKNLKKVVVLDDDVVVQQDLSSLWKLDMEGKVNGAVQFCGVRMHKLDSHLNGKQYYPDSCAWMSGLNVVDLEKWREHDVTGIYQKLLLKMKRTSEASWRAAMLPTSLLAFQNLIYPLNHHWALSGLGHDYRISADAIKDAATLHYNGNMKPWLDLAIPSYKKYWKKYLKKDVRFMDDCNVNC